MRDTYILKIPSEFDNPAVLYVFNYILDLRLGMQVRNEATSDSHIQLIKEGSTSSFHFALPHSVHQFLELSYPLDQLHLFNEQYDCPQVLVTQGDDVGFDVVSGIFFLLTRYEEYVCNTYDQHGRFLAEHSIQKRWKSLRRPLVDVWILRLRQQFSGLWPDSELKEEKFSCTNTLDIDQLFAVRGKPIFKVAGRALQDLLRLDGVSFGQRIRALFGGPDPFGISSNRLKEMKNPILFFLMKGGTAYDKNIWLGSDEFDQFVRSVLGTTQVGLHPSYFTSDGDGRQLVLEEKRHLEKITEKNAVASRQHFLRFKLPDTYRKLIASGIEKEFSMGFADDIGFRAGTSRPFYFFDLGSQQVTELMVVPFSVMDVTLMSYLGLTPEEAITVVFELMKTVSDLGGMFVSLWHNESLADFEHWRNWPDVHTKMLEKQKELMDEV